MNGDNTLPNLRRDEGLWNAASKREQSGTRSDYAEHEQYGTKLKVVLTEEEFAKRMFEE